MFRFIPYFIGALTAMLVVAILVINVGKAVGGG
jgi:hypothetical protein